MSNFSRVLFILYLCLVTVHCLHVWPVRGSLLESIQVGLVVAIVYHLVVHCECVRHQCTCGVHDQLQTYTAHRKLEDKPNA